VGQQFVAAFEAPVTLRIAESRANKIAWRELLATFVSHVLKREGIDRMSRHDRIKDFLFFQTSILVVLDVFRFRSSCLGLHT
jgi:hypothetical protein